MPTAAYSVGCFPAAFLKTGIKTVAVVSSTD